MKKSEVDKLLVNMKHLDLGRFNKKKRILIDIAMIVIGILWIALSINAVTNKSSKIKAEFISCIDGDTFKAEVEYKEETIRLLAIDTPELKGDEYYSKEASEYLCKKLENAKSIKIEFDKKSDKYDKYDRLLGWIYIDDELIQTSLVSYGYANVAYIYDDYKYVDDLKTLEDVAKKTKIGIWSK